MIRADAGQAFWRVIVGEDCISSGQCEMTAPDLFARGDDGQSRYLKNDVATDRLEEIRTAVLGCPVAAIELIADRKRSGEIADQV